jgi:hypothetical protein
MNTRALFLLWATFASAIPLKKGDTWTWVVRNRATNDSSFRTATVLDSVLRDSGTAWFVQGRDSATRKQDTGLLLARPNGSQSWLHASRWLPWDPQPWNGKVGHFYAGLGIASGLYPFPKDTVGLPWAAVVRGSDSFAITADGYPSMTLAGGDGQGSMDLPTGTWIDSVGLVEFLLTDYTRGTLALLGQTEWTLRIHGSAAVTVVPDSLAVPDSGAVFVWEELVKLDSSDFLTQTTSTTLRQRVWSVLSRPADSSGWNRIRVLETMVVPGKADTSDTLDLRFDRRTGARLPARGTGCPMPDDGWWSNWSDTSYAAWRVRHFHWGTSRSDGETSTIADLAWTEWLVAGTGVDSANCSVSSSANTDISSDSKSSWIIRVMLSANGRELRISSALSPPSRPRSGHRESLAVLAARFPDVSVRWTDPRGRSGQFPASLLARTGRSKGLLILDASFPDGTRWKGPWLEGVGSR